MFCVFKFYIIPYSYYNFIVSDKVTKKDLPTAKKIKKKHPEPLRISLKNCNFAASLKKNAMEFTGKLSLYSNQEAEWQSRAMSGKHKNT